MRLSKRVIKLVPDQLRYARQLGVVNIIGYIPDEPYPWEYLELVKLRKVVENYGLKLTSIGSPPRALMHEITTAGPEREKALDTVCECITNMGKAGIPILCYAFSITSTWGHWRTGLNGGERGDAGVMSFDWELVKDAPLTEAGEVGEDEMWRRCTAFLERVVPVAEAAGVKLACHPDDPPVPVMRGTARILSSVVGLKRLVETVPSAANGLNFCQGTVGEMGADVEASIRHFLAEKKINVVHFRNIRRSQTPHLKYDEAFIDQGDMDMIRTMRIYLDLGYDGLFDPDHAPVMEGDGQWTRERGYAYALGYMTAVKQIVERGGTA